MSWVRIWIHLVFATKNRELFLTKEIRDNLYPHIMDNCKKKEIWLESVNGHSDHLHCLISLGREQSISNVAQLIKGESSHWLNTNQLTQTKFAWQDDFWAVSVSESHVGKVKDYISIQEEHHKERTFTNEIEDFVKKYGWSEIKNNNEKCG